MHINILTDIHTYVYVCTCTYICVLSPDLHAVAVPPPCSQRPSYLSTHSPTDLTSTTPATPATTAATASTAATTAATTT